MTTKSAFCLLVFCALQVSSFAVAQSEAERYRAFKEFQVQQKKYDLEREKGFQDYVKDEAEWEDQKQKAVGEYKKMKKTESPHEGGSEYKADREEKYQDWLESEKLRKQYLAAQKAKEPKNLKETEERNKWAMEELGLDKERPRYEISKRALYGAPGKWAGKGGTPSSGGSSGGTSFGGSGSSGGGGGFPPPPPPFDDFGNDGFVPPPMPAPDFENDGFIPPPPPPPAFPGSEDFPGDGFIPPPPPPPIMDAPGDF